VDDETQDRVSIEMPWKLTLILRSRDRRDLVLKAEPSSVTRWSLIASRAPVATTSAAA
jgi:hypothetical protein